MYAAAAWGLLVGLAVPLVNGSIAEAAHRKAASASPVMSSDALVVIAMGSAVLGGIVGAALWVFLAVMNSRGKRWARILATIACCAPIIAAVAAWSNGPLGVWLAVKTVVGALLVTLIAVALWRPGTSRYFEATSKSAAGVHPRG